MMKIPFEIAKIFPQKKKVIGLDIGCSSIKLAEFVRRDGKLTLVNLKLKEIDLQKDRKSEQVAAIQDLFQDVDTKEVKINVVINCPRSCTRILTIPFMPKSEILEALKWEMKNFISFSIEEAALDYAVLEEVSEGGIKKLKLAVACSPQETVKSFLDLLNQAGIRPHLFTQPGFALKNILGNLTATENQTLAVLDIGCNFSELFIFKNRELAFSRRLPVAGSNFTQDMSQVLVSDLGKIQLTQEEAEEIKKKYGVPDANIPEVLEGKLTCAQLLSFLRPNLERLVADIERSFVFYREKEHGQEVEKIIFLGGGSELKGLVQNLSEELDTPAELGNPLKNLVSSESVLFKEKKDSAHRFAHAIGVAFSAII